jgi:hypothetical protein
MSKFHLNFNSLLKRMHHVQTSDTPSEYLTAKKKGLSEAHERGKSIPFKTHRVMALESDLPFT